MPIPVHNISSIQIDSSFCPPIFHSSISDSDMSGIEGLTHSLRTEGDDDSENENAELIGYLLPDPYTDSAHLKPYCNCYSTSTSSSCTPVTTPNATSALSTEPTRGPVNIIPTCQPLSLRNSSRYKLPRLILSKGKFNLPVKKFCCLSTLNYRWKRYGY
jgi:hypothetical protein